ncbi:MAG: hypothetical protein NC177_08115 [Ruminococcus flavefaciens]|nr:hypothetical protein [Ruminococcus flavefaciens]
MRELSDDFWEWTDIKNGKRIIKDDAPEDVRRKLTEEEKEFFRKTARRCIINVDIEESSGESNS